MKYSASLIVAGLAAIAAAAPNKATTTSKAELPSYPGVSSKGCVTTSAKSMRFAGCVFDSTRTQYHSTVTLYESVNCNGCVSIDIKTMPQFHCPIEIFTATVTAREPSTTVETVCKATPTK